MPNTLQKGNVALGKAISYFTENGYTVSVPLNDSQWYDLVVEKDSQLFTVQVKYSGTKTKCGSYIVNLKTVSGSTRKVMYSVKDTPVDYLFCYCENGLRYLIPAKHMNASTQITLNLDKSKFSNKDLLDTSIYLV